MSDERGFWRRNWLLFILVAALILSALVPVPRGRLSRRRGPAAGHADIDLRSVDINRAGAGELAALPGIGPRLAEAIVAEREKGGGFRFPEDLRRVKGIGPAKVKALKPYVITAGDGRGR